MKKKITVMLSDEALLKVEKETQLASEGFESGRITISDVVNEMVLSSDIDIRSLQSKCINLKKSILNFAKQKNPDLDQMIKTLQELKGKSSKKPNKANRETEEKSE